jgi:hypothetical protein
LTPIGLLRLKLFARQRIFLLGDYAAGREDTDLLHEAILATAIGDRRWVPANVPFEKHLMGAMKSISYAWAQKRKSEVRMPPPEEKKENGEKGLVPFDNIPDPEPHPEQQMVRHETEQTVLAFFRNDWEAHRVLEALIAGQTKKDIRKSLGITEEAYSTAKKRIQRRLPKFLASQSEWRKQKSAISEVP